MTAATSSMAPWQRERRWLGYAGLIPFVACLGVILVADDARRLQVAVDTLRHYAAVIASFLGAVHWGVAVSARDGLRRARLRWGVMPALIGWTLLAVPATFAFAGFALLFVLILAVDRYLLPILDDGYRRLRLQLSLVVVATLAGAAFALAGNPT